jgi:SAM-dependent methyltransferase/pimeloyl-ACP methyl ester carboxylesterase
MRQQENCKSYRRLPRIKIHIPIVSKGLGTKEIESIEKFTPDGFFLKASTDPSPGEIFDCDFILPDSKKHVSAKVQVVSTVKKNVTGFGAKIVEISDEDLLFLERTYLEYLGNTFSPHIAPLLNRDSYQPVFPFSDKKITCNFLNKLFIKSIKITLINEDITWITEGFYAYIAGSNIYMFLTDTDIFSKCVKGEWIRVFIESEKDFFYFHSHITEISPNKITIDIPDKVFSQGRRRHYRAIQDPDWKMTVDIPLPYPIGASMRREIIDISSNGLGFKSDVNDQYFLPGTPLTNISIYRKDEKIMQTQGEVRHVTPFRDKDGKKYLKVGVQFKIRSKRFSKGYMPTSSEQFQSSERAIKDKEKCEYVDLNKLGIHKMALTCPWESRKIFYKNKNNEEIAAILDWTVDRGNSMSVIIICPALGKRKESTGLLASMLLQNFRLYGHKVAIIRYDGIRNMGESYNDIECRQPGKDMLHLTLSQYVEDILSTLDFCYSNGYFIPDKTILITPSMSAVAGRRALAIDEKKRVHLWISLMGVSHPRRVLSSISGGIDYLHIMNLGRKAGVASVLGCTIDWDNFWQDAQKNKLISVSDSKKDLASIDIPIIWIRGLYDAWISSDDISSLLRDYPQSKKRIVDIPTGHLPLNGQEAIRLFSLIISHIWNFLFDQRIKMFTPDHKMIETCLQEEWSQSHISSTKTPEKFWSVRLIEKMAEYTDDGILSLSKEYRELIEQQCALIELSEDNHMLDIGCTENGLLKLLSEIYSTTTWHPSLIRMKKDLPFKKELHLCSTFSHLLTSDINFQYIECNIDLNSLLIIKQFCSGEFITFDRFKGTINGLTDYSVELWKKYPSEHLFSILKGKSINDNDIKVLHKTFPDQEVKLILEMNRAARFIKENHSSFANRQGHNEAAKFKNPIFTFSNGLYNLPFESESFDRLLCTLVLSYTRNPFSMFNEFYRILKKGGIIVCSFLKPDSDLSVLYVDIISCISQESPDNFIENFTSDRLQNYVKESGNVAVFLSHLFGRAPLHFFNKNMIEELCYCVDFKNISISESYGEPSKALIMKARK